MDPNVKFLLDDAMKLMRVEITNEITKCFADHDAVFDKRFEDLSEA